MKAIILAAGYGTRLRPLTRYLPKPLMPVIGVPLLEHIITKLEGCKVSGIGINLHHNHTALERFFDQRRPGPDIHLSHEERILGVAGGIGGFRAFLRDDRHFIVHNGDILSSLSIADLVMEHDRNSALCTLALHDCPSYNNVSMATDGTIVDIRDSLKTGKNIKKYAYTGIAVMDTDMLGFIPHGPADLIPLLLDIISDGRYRIAGFDTGNPAWCDVGTVGLYLDAHRQILCRNLPLVAQNRIPPSAVCLGPDTDPAGDVRFRGFVSAGSRCRLGRESMLEDCVLWDDAVVQPGAMIQNAVVGPDWVVRA